VKPHLPDLFDDLLVPVRLQDFEKIVSMQVTSPAVRYAWSFENDNASPLMSPLNARCKAADTGAVSKLSLGPDSALAELQGSASVDDRAPSGTLVIRLITELRMCPVCKSYVQERLEHR
jgi:hypothetical protein